MPTWHGWLNRTLLQYPVLRAEHNPICFDCPIITELPSPVQSDRRPGQGPSLRELQNYKPTRAGMSGIII